jgi:hypothetical protein
MTHILTTYEYFRSQGGGRGGKVGGSEQNGAERNGIEGFTRDNADQLKGLTHFCPLALICNGFCSFLV